MASRATPADGLRMTGEYQGKPTRAGMSGVVIDLRQDPTGGPATRLQVNREATRLAVLKQRLVLRRLDESPNLESHALIMREADAAEWLACATGLPLLVFPCLFEEMVCAALERDQRWLDHYWDCLMPATRQPVPRGQAQAASRAVTC